MAVLPVQTRSGAVILTDFEEFVSDTLADALLEAGDWLKSRDRQIIYGKVNHHPEDGSWRVLIAMRPARRSMNNFQASDPIT